MKKAEMFSYMLFAITLFTLITMTHFWGTGIVVAIVAMLCGASFIACFMIHEEEG